MRTKNFITDLRDAVTRLNNALTHAEQEINRLRDENNTLNVQIVRLTHDNDALHDECLHREEMCAEYRSDIYRLKDALRDISRMPEGDEQSAQAVAREVLKYW